VLGLSPAASSPPPRTVALAPSPSSPPTRAAALASSKAPRTVTLPPAPRALHAALPFGPPAQAPFVSTWTRAPAIDDTATAAPRTRRLPRRPEPRPPLRLGPVAFAAVMLLTAALVAGISIGLVTWIAGPVADAPPRPSTAAR
jgi:hypothetical protein